MSVMENNVERLVEDVEDVKDDVGRVRQQIEEIKTHLTAQDREFQKLVQRAIGAFFVLQIIVPLLIKYFWK